MRVINNKFQLVFRIHNYLCFQQGEIMTGFPQKLHTQAKYFVGVPLFDKICIDMNIFDQKRIK